jgi:hypothetical protein
METPGIGTSFDLGGVPLSGQEKNKVRTSLSVYPHSDSTGEIVPSWVAFDRKVLRFYAYFQESVQERREEKYRIRRLLC